MALLLKFLDFVNMTRSEYRKAWLLKNLEKEKNLSNLEKRFNVDKLSADQKINELKK